MNVVLYTLYLLNMAILVFTQITEPLRFIANKFPLHPTHDIRLRRVHRKDNGVKISCEMSNNTVKVYLLNKGKKTINKTITHFGKRMNQINQTFIINDINLADAGNYFCIADNGAEEMKLGLLQIIRAPCFAEPRWDTTENTKITKQFEKNDDMLEIKCLAVGGTSCKKYLSLEKLNGSRTVPLTLNSCSYMVINRITYDVATFLISNPQKEHEGIYRCKRKAQFCQNDTWTHADMEVKFIRPQAPIIKILQGNIVHVRKGTAKLLLECNVTASPVPDITWEDQSRNVTQHCPRKRYCKYEVVGIQRDGNISCKAVNSEGSQTALVFMDILTRPTVKEIPLRSDRTFKCVTEGNPRPYIIWQKCSGYTQKRICNESSWVKLYDDGSHIKIKNTMRGNKFFSIISFLKSEEFGHVRCVGNNSVGNDSNDFYLRKPKVGSEAMIIGLICGIVFLISVFIVIIFCYRRYMMHKYALYMTPNKTFKFDHDRSIFDQSIELPYDIEWEFPKQRLDMVKVIGSGNFGEVWIANASGIEALAPRDKSTDASRKRTLLKLDKKVPRKLLSCIMKCNDLDKVTTVAAKTLKGNPSHQEYKDLASEIKILIHLGSHKNIVNILGACTSGGNLIAIMEFCPNDCLTKYLKSRRGVFSDSWKRQSNGGYDNDFSLVDMAYAALQISRGMTFLSNKKLVHRDLAARNILVHDNFVLKIADFGLARDLRKNDIYCKTGTGFLPLKWLAPESLFDNKCTVKSDVWSFGVVMWEIFTMGGTPYPGMRSDDVIDNLRNGYKMQKPMYCPEDIYEVMNKCWDYDPVNRPCFSTLETMLENIMKSKVTISTNLATFDERLKSLSDESDYLIQTSPTRLKRNSFDQFLESRRELAEYSKPRKMSADVLSHPVFTFPPADDVFIETNNNRNYHNSEEKKNQNEYIIAEFAV